MIRMINTHLSINPQKETKKIVQFLRNTFKKQHMNKAVIGLSGGIDSMVCYYLLKKALPEKNIIAVYLPYQKYTSEVYLEHMKNLISISIKKSVDEIVKSITKSEDTFFEKKTVSSDAKIRVGNIMARVRMIVLFDLAKKHNALVCGTENKTEHLLGYFTRFGDAASDIEPIQHLYKTQVRQLAQYLGVPKQIIHQHPTAGLWSGQTDEKEFGFTYEEADQVLYLYFERKISLSIIKKQGFKNTEKIISYAQKNSFKLKTPYFL